ncbi:MAG TPA: UbiA-like polyprenyltransferase [Syntrophorhabdaceae bacterium]|nr:UbiA-like polyprenyltransferase [Syntrophorhabdaceae bacterium]
MIKFEHTIFALPFAYIGVFLAAKGFPDVKKFFLITIAFSAARTYAMTLNRIIDLKYDSKNPRTSERHLVKGIVRKKTAIYGVLISFIVFVITAYALGPLPFILTPVALFFLSFYHITKRFTYFSHFFLGLTDGLAPAGAWVAIRGSFFTLSDQPAWILIFIVTFWIAGFDILYQCQDIEFDRKEGLHTIPSRFGTEMALKIARLCHIIMLLGLVYLGFFLNFNIFYIISLVISTVLLLKEHSLISPHDLSKLDMAFFNMNGYISIIIFLGIMLSIFTNRGYL